LTQARFEFRDVEIRNVILGTIEPLKESDSFELTALFLPRAVNPRGNRAPKKDCTK